MKVLFIEAIKKVKFGIEELNKLPKDLHLLYPVQYKNIAQELKKQLENKGHKILAFQQILGCSKIKPKASLVLIGSGKFHALSLALSTNKEVYIYDGVIKKITKEEIEKEKNKNQGKKLKFLSSENISLLASKKPGQNRLRNIGKIKRELARKFKEKKFYIFISDTIDIRELENFLIDIWVNVACPGLALDSKKIINYEEIKDF